MQIEGLITLIYFILHAKTYILSFSISSNLCSISSFIYADMVTGLVSPSPKRGYLTWLGNFFNTSPSEVFYSSSIITNSLGFTYSITLLSSVFTVLNYHNFIRFYLFHNFII